jgi:hypothetical protein
MRESTPPLGLWSIVFLFSSIFCSTVAAQSLAIYGKDFINETFKNPDTLWVPPLSAGVSFAKSELISPDAGYGSGPIGYAHFYVVALGDSVNGKFMRYFAFAAASGHEDDYVPSANGKLWTRIGRAALHTFVVNPEDSTKQFNWSGIPASLASAGLSNAYQPEPQRTWSVTFERAGWNALGYAGGNIWNALTEKHPKLHTFLRTR